MENIPYTREVIVFRKTLENQNLDMSEPTFVMEDSVGHIVVSDGNHREFKAATQGVAPPRRLIGRINKDVSKDSDYRRVIDLKVVDSNPPDFNL